MRSQQLRPCKSPRFDGFAIGWSKRRNRKSNRPRETRPLIASDSAARKRLLPLRVFGCLPVTARRAARRQASEKPRRRKPRGKYAPAAVSVYGDLRRGSARLGRSRTALPAWMGSGVGDFGWRACHGPRAGVLKDLGFGGRGRG